MTPPSTPSYAGHRFPPEVISHAVWLYFRFPLGLRMVEELLAARSITVSHETVRQWALKFGQGFANEIRRRLPRPGDKWHLDEVQIKIAGKKHWLWQAVDQDGTVLDVLVQSRRDKKAAKRLLRKPAEEADAAAARAGHGQAGELSGGEAGADARRRTSAAQGAQQSGRKLPPADTATRTADEAVQITPPGATVPLRPRPDQQPLPSLPRSPSCRRVPSRPRASVRDLGRDHWRQGRRIGSQLGRASALPRPLGA